MSHLHLRAYYYLVTNTKKKITVQVCQLAPFLREMGMDGDYQKIGSGMRNDEKGKMQAGIYEFRRITENPYPKIRMMLNGEIQISKTNFVVEDGIVKEKKVTKSVAGKVNPPRKQSPQRGAMH